MLARAFDGVRTSPFHGKRRPEMTSWEFGKLDARFALESALAEVLIDEAAANTGEGEVILFAFLDRISKVERISKQIRVECSTTSVSTESSLQRPITVKGFHGACYRSNEIWNVEKLCAACLF